MKRETTIDLYMGIEMLQAAWMAVPASRIANYFWHASFGISSGGYCEGLGAAANEAAAGYHALASWEPFLDAGVVPDCDTFCMYVSADDDAVMTEELTEAEIMRAVMCVPNDDSDECVDDSQEPNVGEPDVSMFEQAPDAADLLRSFFGAHNEGEDELEIAAATEIAIIPLKKTQKKIYQGLFF
ncbi:hypothetical protein HPB49_005013 [Dermacentor silvarum]|uniref:Uncharacterized protein n=1 Tax=Dermacentor silvarum TaxID=543639 RepID=A0ACB8CQ01_DERSI|nr:hypothetical protein HPB49_005013 [Dermacentor silvarum]